MWCISKQVFPKGREYMSSKVKSSLREHRVSVCLVQSVGERLTDPTGWVWRVEPYPIKPWWHDLSQDRCEVISGYWVLCHNSQSYFLTVQLPEEVPWRQCRHVQVFVHHLCLALQQEPGAGSRACRNCIHHVCPAVISSLSCSSFPCSLFPYQAKDLTTQAGIGRAFAYVCSKSTSLFSRVRESRLLGTDDSPCGSVPLSTFSVSLVQLNKGSWSVLIFSHDQKNE